MRKSKLELIAKKLVEKFPGHIIVPGEGPEDAKVMLIGQNPGEQEEKTGRPFIGRAGKYLNKVLAKNGIDRQKVFITSVVKFRTPENRLPDESEVLQNMPLMVEQIEAIAPKVVVLMGKLAWQVPEVGEIEFVKTYHPSAAMRFSKMRARFEGDFEKVAPKIRKLLK